MFLAKLFRSKKKKDKYYNRDEYEEELARTRYADIETENIVHELNMSDEASAKHYIVDLCEQIIDVSRELEETKAEYQVVTNYLNDIQMLEEMSAEQKEPIIDCATRVAKLDNERMQYLNTQRRLSESQFAQMQELEEELPGTIRRLRANETYLDTIKKDLSYLEGEKLEWAMLKSESLHQQKLLRKLSCYLMVIYPTLMGLFGLLMWFQESNTRIPMMLSTAMAALLGVYILIKYQDAIKDQKRSEINRNHAISLENHVKIKYVNIKNAVDYTCEKYHTTGAKDLEYIFEQYQEEVRDTERFRRTNDDLEFYRNALVEKLREMNLYDAKVWINHSNAIIDNREMVELKHDLITRRQKLRSRMEYNISTIAGMKKEALRHAGHLGADEPHVQQIIQKIENL